MTTHPQPILIRLSDVSDVGASTGHRTAYVTTTLPAILEGLRNLECQDTPWTPFKDPAALLTDLLAGLAGALERDAVYGSEVERLRALLAEQVARAERAEREVRRAWSRAASLWDGYDALKDFLDDESEDARERSYSHLADHFQERVIEARETLSKRPRPREDQLAYGILTTPAPEAPANEQKESNNG